MKLGNLDIKDIYVGSLSASQMFLGDQKVWPAEEPVPYISVDYIKSNGQQCLVTGQYPQSNDSWELTWGTTMRYADLPSNAGENKGWSNNIYWSSGGRYIQGQIKPWLMSNISYNPSIDVSTVSADEIFTEHVDAVNSNLSLTLYRHATQTQSTATRTNPRYFNQYSFSLAYENVWDAKTRGFAYMKIYRWKHWRSGQLIQDLIPVNYNGHGAMYDLISKQFFTSTTGVDFLLPE